MSVVVPIHSVVLEGPDCSGKSTLFRTLHSATGHSHNIHDRSTLSMLCYSLLYGRSDVRRWRKLYERETRDGNVFHVVVIPPEDVLLARLQKRGDEYQDAKSIVKLRVLFLSEVHRTPNTLVLEEVLPKDETAALVKAVMERYETQGAGEFGSSLRGWLDGSGAGEIQFRVSLSVPHTYEDPTCLVHPHESRYYMNVMRRLEEKIYDETLGNNPYGVAQTPDSTRRFFETDDTCISSIHVLPRHRSCKVIVTLRSTHAIRNGEIDVRFLTHLAAKFGSRWTDRSIDLELNFNSLHHGLR